ncbi:MAG: four helix bundle protein [Bacteroidia bacterium]
MHRFKELKVWQQSVDLAVDVYKVAKKFPSEERYGIISQIQRSAVSIPSNIAEGAGRNTNNEFNHFLGISSGSSNELETQLIIANKLDYLNTEILNQISKQIFDVQNMLSGLKGSLFK